MLVVERGTEIGRKIAALRFEHALTKAGLAKLSGVNEITISNIERGKQQPSARSLRKIAAAFGVEVRELTTGARELPPDEPGLTTENETKIGQAKRQKAERDEETRLQGEKNASDTGDRRA